MKIHTKQSRNNPLRIFTWHIHGSYLYYLTQVPYEFYIPYDEKRSPGYVGKTKNFQWGSNVHEIAKEEVKNAEFDLILFQSNYGSINFYEEEKYTLLSQKQLALPKIYLEHDPPRKHPTDTKHLVDDPSMLLVHVTHFNELMWDNNRTPTTVIEHGVTIPQKISYSGKLQKGVVMVNNIVLRGRRVGLDIFKSVQKKIPLDLIGMGSEQLDGLGEIPHHKLSEFLTQYRFFFNPIRYTSLPLSLCEAMMLGLPIIAVATTELPTIIENNISGYTDTTIENLIKKMQFLLDNPLKAQEMSLQSKYNAQKRFSLHRFIEKWSSVIQEQVQKTQSPLPGQKFFFNRLPVAF